MLTLPREDGTVDKVYEDEFLLKLLKLEGARIDLNAVVGRNLIGQPITLAAVIGSVTEEFYLKLS